MKGRKMKNGCKTHIHVSLIVSAILMVVLGATTVCAKNYYVATTGDEKNPGTLAEPFATIQKAADTVSAGDTCYIRGGTYHETIAKTTDTMDGTEANPITFTNYKNEVVTLDGTEAITGTWTKHSGNIYKIGLSTDIWQLFVDGEMMISARWPNATTWDQFLDDETYWGRQDKFDKATTPGVLADLPHDDIDLAAENKSFEGAIAILNVGFWKTWVRKINSHSAGSKVFTYDKTKKAPWKRGRGRYMIEGCDLDLLDTEKEWHYDYTGKVLYLWAPGGGSPSSTIRGKTQSYAFDIVGNDYIKIKGLNFFGTTVRFRNCTNITIDECNFKYPSYSKRMLGSVDNIELTEITNQTAFIQADNVFRRCSVEYSDGPAILMRGKDNVIEDNFFNWIDYSAVNVKDHIGRERTAFSISTRDAAGITYRHNTLMNAGSGMQFRSGDDAQGDTNLVEYNYHAYGCNLGFDGGSFQLAPSGAHNATVRYNWVHDVKDIGVRYDGQVAKAPKYSTGAMHHHNVVWNVAGDRPGQHIKGNYQEVYNNLGRNSENAVDICIWTEWDRDPPNLGMLHSTARNNAADQISGDKVNPNYPLPGTHSNNWTGDLTTQLRDPVNWDFRPKPGSALIDAGYVVDGVTDGYLGSAPDIGAYEYGDTNYWLPGCRFKEASMPVPPDDAANVKLDADLMWLGGRDATSYNIYFCTSAPGSFKEKQSNNIYDPGMLSPDTTYYWRIDTVTASGTMTGDVWSFCTTKEGFLSVQRSPIDRKP